MVQYIEAVDGIVLEATARNAQDVSKAVMPWYAKLFISPRVSDSLGAYDLVESLKSFDAPILVLGAEKDKTLPVALSRKLAKGLSEVGANVTYVEFPDANHISIPTQSAYPSMIATYISGLSIE
jgi:pimeloyl-ACP methyl ester carboxylesterase